MQKSQFIYFKCLETNTDLLKEEVKQKCPNWKISFQKKNFLTYKVDSELSLSDLEELEIIFCLDLGLSIGKVGTIDWQGISFYEMIKLGTGEFIETLPKEAPSRAYLKIKEAVERFKIPIKSGDIALELGASPGGATYYLLEQGLSVYALDPAKLSPTLFEMFPNSINHLEMPVQKFDPKSITEQVDWITVDMNLSPFESAFEVARIARTLKPKGMIITLKLPTKNLISRIDQITNPFLSMNYNKLIRIQLISHKREFCLICLN